MEPTNEQIKGLLASIAKEYLPPGRQSISDVFGYPNKHAVLHDLESMGKSYDLTKEQDVIKAAKDAYNWNLFLLEKNHGIADEDITVSEEEAFLLTTVLGHKGAIPYLTGKEIDIEKISSILEENKPAEPVLEEEKLEEPEIVNPPQDQEEKLENEKKKVAEEEPEQEFDSSLIDDGELLEEVVVTAKKESPLELESGRTVEDVNAEAQSRLDELSKEKGGLTDEEALEAVRQEIGEDEVSLRTNNNESIQVIGKAIKGHGYQAIAPMISLAQSSGDYAILQDKYENAGELQLKGPPEGFGLGEKFILSYFSQNMQYPVDDETGLVNASFSEIDDPYRMVLNISPEAVEQYLPDISEEEKEQLSSAPLVVPINEYFQPEVYQQWKDWAQNEANISGETLQFKIFDKSVAIVETEALVEQSKDKEYLNEVLDRYENADISSVRDIEINRVIRTRDSYKALKEHQEADENRGDLTEEAYTQAQESFSKAQSEAEQNITDIENRIDVLKSLRKDIRKELGKDAGDLVRQLIRLEKVNLKAAEMDAAILDDSSNKDDKRRAKKYMNARQKEDKIIYDRGRENRQAMLASEAEISSYLTGEQAEIFASSMQENKEHITPSDKEGLEADLEELNSGLADKDKEFSATSVGVSAGLHSSSATEGIMASLEGKHKSYTDIGKKTSLEADIDLRPGLVSNNPQQGDTEFISPMEQNPVDYTSRQKLTAGLNYKYNSFNELSLSGGMETSVGGEATEFLLSNRFYELDGDITSVGIQMPSKYEFISGDVNSKIGGVVGREGTLFLTGDELGYSFTAGLSAASFDALDPTLSLDSTSYLTLGGNFRYNKDKFNAMAGAEFSSLSPFSSEEGFNNLSTNLRLSRQFGDVLVGVYNRNFFSDNFNLVDIGASTSLSTQNLSHHFEAGLTRLKAIFPGASQEQLTDILNIGYRLGLNGKEGSIFEDMDIGAEINISGSDIPLKKGEVTVTKRF